MKQFGLGRAGGMGLERLTREPRRITVARKATHSVVQRLPSDMSVALCNGCLLSFRYSTAFRICCNATPASRSFLMIRRTSMSWNEYRRWVPEPPASRMDGVTRPVRAPVPSRSVLS